MCLLLIISPYSTPAELPVQISALRSLQPISFARFVKASILHTRNVIANDLFHAILIKSFDAEKAFSN